MLGILGRMKIKLWFYLMHLAKCFYIGATVLESHQDCVTQRRSPSGRSSSTVAMSVQPTEIWAIEPKNETNLTGHHLSLYMMKLLCKHGTAGIGPPYASTSQTGTRARLSVVYNELCVKHNHRTL